jgi:hypothetical protein
MGKGADRRRFRNRVEHREKLNFRIEDKPLKGQRDGYQDIVELKKEVGELRRELEIGQSNIALLQVEVKRLIADRNEWIHSL